MMEKTIRIFTRRCKRCRKLYETTSRYSKICENCKKPTGGKYKWQT